ncbi:hypothetical protein ACTXT7_009427 [Hymenolepis weldensis]
MTLCIFGNYSFPFYKENTSVFRPRSPGDVFRPYDAKPLSVMSKRVYRFPPFYNRLVSLKVHCTHPYARPCPGDSRLSSTDESPLLTDADSVTVIVLATHEDPEIRDG